MLNQTSQFQKFLSLLFLSTAVVLALLALSLVYLGPGDREMLQFLGFFPHKSPKYHGFSWHVWPQWKEDGLQKWNSSFLPALKSLFRFLKTNSQTTAINPIHIVPLFLCYILPQWLPCIWCSKSWALAPNIQRLTGKPALLACSHNAFSALHNPESHLLTVTPRSNGKFFTHFLWVGRKPILLKTKEYFTFSSAVPQ